MNFPNIPLIEDDIANVNQSTLNRLGVALNNIDLVIGGPPCQSYSTVGKRQYDKRAKMYQEYFRMLDIIRPRMFIFENVTGLLSMQDDKANPIIDTIINMFSDINGDGQLGYTIRQRTLNAKNYGVPQNRERVFLVGIRNDLNCGCWDFPEETHSCQKGESNFLTVAAAISDLPQLAEGGVQLKYVAAPSNEYQRLMRFNSNQLFDHDVGNYGEKIRAVIETVPQGEGRSYFNQQIEAGLVNPKYYLTSGYKNTYGRLWWDRPSTTLTNSFSTPSSLRCIHPLQNRALSTREGARLQSFPDWFRFVGNKYERNSQIGNAVPPLLAMALAKSVKKCFNCWEE